MHSKKLNSIILKDLQAAGRQGGLGGIEIIEGVVLADEEWTVANVSELQILHRHFACAHQILGLDNCDAEDQPERHLKKV